jgi:hypothetical protein
VSEDRIIGIDVGAAGALIAIAGLKREGGR